MSLYHPQSHAAEGLGRFDMLVGGPNADAIRHGTQTTAGLEVADVDPGIQDSIHRHDSVLVESASPERLAQQQLVAPVSGQTALSTEAILS